MLIVFFSIGIRWRTVEGLLAHIRKGQAHIRNNWAHIRINSYSHTDANADFHFTILLITIVPELAYLVGKITMRIMTVTLGFRDIA